MRIAKKGRPEAISSQRPPGPGPRQANDHVTAESRRRRPSWNFPYIWHRYGLRQGAACTVHGFGSGPPHVIRGAFASHVSEATLCQSPETMSRFRYILLLAVLIFVAVAAWQLRPERRLHRSWDKLIDVVEARHARALGNLLAEEYADRWGYRKATLVQDARLAFHHFSEIEIRIEQQEILMDGDRATITAMLRVDVRGTERAAEARVAANSLFSPFTFEWRRDDSFPWAWKLATFDQPEFDLGRFRRSVSGSY